MTKFTMSQLNIRTITIMIWAMISVSGISGCQGCNDMAIPDSPDGTVETVLKKSLDGKPQIIWAAMPESYKKDVNSLVGNFAQKMDQDLWNKAFVIASKTVDVAKTKKDFILANPMASQIFGEKSKELKENWSSVAQILEIIVNSDIAKLEKLKTFDGGKFLSSTVSELILKSKDLKKLIKDDAPTDMEGVTIETVKTNGKTATVKITDKEGKAETFTMIKVEGRWVPEELAKEWPDFIKQAQEGIAEISGEEMKQNKPKVLAAMAAAESVVDQLKSAKTQAEFDTVVQGLLTGGLF
jgi:hypothetical protein